MSDKDTWICTRCKWQGDVHEIIKHEIFAATREEPAEWQWYCPDCNFHDSLEELYENAAWCKTCEDVIVKDEGNICTECMTCHAEALADEAKGH